MSSEGSQSKLQLLSRRWFYARLICILLLNYPPLNSYTWTQRLFYTDTNTNTNTNANANANVNTYAYTHIL